MRVSRIEPVHRLSHEGYAQTNAPPDLCGKFFESFEPKSARCALLRSWQRRRDGEVISHMQRDCLIDDFEVVFELLELTTHAVEAAQQRGVVNGLIVPAGPGCCGVTTMPVRYPSSSSGDIDIFGGAGETKIAARTAVALVLVMLRPAAYSDRIADAPRPRQKVIEPRSGPEVHKPAQNVGQIRLRIDPSGEIALGRISCPTETSVLLTINMFCGCFGSNLTEN